MRVVVCGAGNVGLSIAQYLGDAYDITLVDQDSVVLAGVTDKLDVRTVTGHAGDPEVLKKAEAHRADIFIAVTGSDEVNIVACQMAHALFDVQLKIARLRLMNTFAPSWFDPYKKAYLPIDIVISAEEETAQEIIRHLKAPFASSVMSFFQEKAYVLGIQLQADSPDCLDQLRLLGKTDRHRSIVHTSPRPHLHRSHVKRLTRVVMSSLSL